TVIDSQPAATVLGIDFDKAVAELNIAPGVILLGLYRGCDDRINSNDRHDEQSAARFQRFKSRTAKRTLVIDRMPQSQRCGKQRQPIEMELENIKVTEISAFNQRFVAREHDPELSLHHAVLIFIADSHHQRRLSIQRSNDYGIAEDDTRDRARKAHENEASHHRQQKYSRHDFYGGDHVSVKRLRIHVAVDHGGQRL